MSLSRVCALDTKSRRNRNFLVTATAGSLMVLSSAVFQFAEAATGTFQQVDDSGLALEAESATRTAVSDASWTIISGDDMSNGEAVYLDTERHNFERNGQGPSLSWNLSTPFKGTYAIWARVRTKDGDSLFTNFDGSSDVHHFSVSNQWVWRKLRAVDLTANSQHELTIFARERRLEIDKLVLQVNGRGVPVDFGPTESVQLQVAENTTEPSQAALTSVEPIPSSSPETEATESAVAVEIIQPEETTQTTVTEQSLTTEEAAPLATESVLDAFSQGADKLVTLEAENAVPSSLGGDWQLVNNSAYSNGQALSLEKTDPSRTHFGKGPSISWTVSAEHSGDYAIWALMRNSGANSVYSSFDGDYGYQYFKSSNSWSWRAFYNRSVKLEAGSQHELQIWGRDAGVELDKIMLIPRFSNYVPDGLGPIESARVSAGTESVASAEIEPAPVVEVEPVEVAALIEEAAPEESAEVVSEVTEVVVAASVPEVVVTENLPIVEVSTEAATSTSTSTELGESTESPGEITAAAEDGGDYFMQGGDKIISLEAESATRTSLNGSWQPVNDVNFSNGVALSLKGVESRLQLGSGPSLAWKIKAKYSGSYKIVALIRNADANSVYSSFNGDQGYQYFLNSSGWSWRLFWNRKIELIEGEEQIFQIQARDPGVDIDKIVLIPVDSDYSPSGEGPIESARNGNATETSVTVSVGESTSETLGLGPEVAQAESTSSSTTVAASAEESEPETAALINTSDLMSDHYPGTENYSKEVELPSCDGPDALRISTVSGLGQINNSSYKVFCIAPGDYRSYGKLAINGAGGTESSPKYIRFESSEFADDDEIFQADIGKLARMPQVDIRNTSHWVLNRLAFIDVSGQPIRMAGANGIVIDRIRLQNNRNGIEFQHGTNNSFVQNSYIGDQVIPRGIGNDGVCIAMMGHYRQVSLDGSINYDYPVVAKNNHVVNNEIFNCNDGFQIVWMPQFKNHPDFQGTIIAGNDIYIDSSRRTNCSGSLSSTGDCAYTENAMDFKAASLDASNPVEVFDNRMWGWRKTDSNYNSPANSWGTAVSTHYSSMKNLHVYENIIWDVGAGIGFTRGSNNSVVRDNIVANVTSSGVNNGVAIMTYSDSYDYYNSQYAYGNVKNMIVERNHLVNVGGAWLSTSAENSTFQCNVVENGSWTATSGSWSTGLNAGRNSYYGTNSGALSRGSDGVHSSGASKMGELCFDTKRASMSGGEQVCLAGVLNTASSPSVCASDYWTADNWN